MAGQGGAAGTFARIRAERKLTSELRRISGVGVGGVATLRIDMRAGGAADRTAGQRDGGLRPS